MTIDPRLFAAIGDVFLNLSAGWFGAALVFPWTYPRAQQANAAYIFANVIFGIIAPREYPAARSGDGRGLEGIGGADSPCNAAALIPRGKTAGEASLP